MKKGGGRGVPPTPRRGGTESMEIRVWGPLFIERLSSETFLKKGYLTRVGAKATSERTTLVLIITCLAALTAGVPGKIYSKV